MLHKRAGPGPGRGTLTSPVPHPRSQRGVWVSPDMWRALRRQQDTKIEDKQQVVHEHTKARTPLACPPPLPPSHTLPRSWCPRSRFN